jgi:hypothetical protein
MQAAEALIPITMFVCGFAMVFGIVYLKTRENLAMVEKGLNPKDKVNRPAPFRSLRTGLFLTGSGLGLFIAYMIEMFVLRPSTYYYGHVPFLFISLVGVGGGIGLIISYVMEKKHWLDKEGTNE